MPILTILALCSAEGTPIEAAINPVTRDANVAACAQPHYEAALRDCRAAYDAIQNGETPTPDLVMKSQFYTLVVTLGPAMAGNLVPFQAPKAKSSGGKDETPTWVEAIRYKLASVAEEAIYAAVRDAFRAVRDGTIKATGLPDTIAIETATPEDLFFEIIRGIGSPSTSLATSEREFDGLSEDMVGKKCKVTFGWYAGSWRTLSEKQRAAVKAAADKKAATAAGSAPAAVAAAATAGA